jgi:hypothetical protein
MDFENRHDPSPAHPLRLDVLERPLEHAGERRVLRDWWMGATGGEVEDPGGLADRVVESFEVEELAMCVWYFESWEGHRLGERREAGEADRCEPVFGRRVWGRLVRRRSDELRSVLDAWARDRMGHLEGRDAMVAAQFVVTYSNAVATFGGETPRELEALVVAMVEEIFDSGSERDARMVVGWVARSLATLSADRRRALRARLAPEVLARVDDLLARAQSAEGRVPIPVWDPDQKREGELGPLVWRY